MKRPRTAGDALSVAAAAREAPDRVALIAGERSWTWRALHFEVARRAQALRMQLETSGASWDQAAPRVALVARSTWQTVLALYALIELRVPFLALHPRWTQVESARALADFADVIRVDPEALAARAEGVALPAGSDPRDAQSREAVDGDGERTLAILFTSGSTGRPKGVVLSRRAFVASAVASAARLGWRGDDRWLVNLPLAHVGGLSILTRVLAARRTAVLGPEGSFGVEQTVALVAQQHVTLLSLVPTMLHRLLEAEPELAPPPSVRAILLGGARAPSGLLERAAHRGWPVLTTYGMTETCSQLATQDPAASRDASPGVGPPLPDFDVRIADAPDLSRLPGEQQSGELTGEILVRGTALCSGYVPEERWGSPFDGEGWLHTGDLGWLDARGNLHVVGRRDELILSGGENVHPAEVEAALEEHPAIAEAAVFGVEDAEWGQRVAAVLRAANEPLSDRELGEHLQTRLARFRWPRLICWTENLPSGANGKNGRQACRHEYHGRLRHFT